MEGLEKLLKVEPERRVRRELSLQVVQAALAAVDPGSAVYNAVQFDPETGSLRVLDHHYNLNNYEHIYVVGAGKASAPMAASLYSLLGARISAGWINVKYGYGLPAGTGAGPIVVHEAGHPIPDEAGYKGTQAICELLQKVTPKDLVFALISGGASALLELPVAGVSLSDLKSLTDALLRSGATINQLNAVRKHLSQVKGGNLTRMAASATQISLIVSDVVGSPLDVIGSGPTAPDATTFETAWRILEQFGLTSNNQLPEAIVQHLRQGVEGTIKDTPKEGDEIFERVQNVIVADNRVAALAAEAKARELGFHTMLLSTFVEGEAREVARTMASIVKEILTYDAPVPRPACILAGGETTVTVRGTGMGGRNQELALASSLALKGFSNFMIIPLATDGSDGPNDAAGALVEEDTLSRASNLGLDANAFLQQNDSYHFFQALGDLLITGPTNTNVNDLTLLFCY